MGTAVENKCVICGGDARNYKQQIAFGDWYCDAHIASPTPPPTDEVTGGCHLGKCITCQEVGKLQAELTALTAQLAEAKAERDRLLSAAHIYFDTDGPTALQHALPSKGETEGEEGER